MVRPKPKETPTQKDARDQQDVQERSSPPALIIYEVVRRAGEEEMERPNASLWWSGFAGGVSISFSILAQAVLDLRLPESPWKPLLVALGYPVGFLMVILGRQQLFTESTISLVLPVMAKPTARNFATLGRVWTIILLANLAGTLGAALFCSFSPVLTPEVLEAFRSLSWGAMDKPATKMFFEAITAGFLMAAMVWLLPNAEGAKFHVIVLITYLIAMAGSAHIVAGSMEAFLLALAGDMGLGRLVGGFMIPALAGNIIGGTFLFALLSYAQVRHEI